MAITYVALGSNLNQPVIQLKKAIIGLSKLTNTSLLQVSSFYENPPLTADSEQANYVNAVAKLQTTLSPMSLLIELLDLERRQGRQRDGRRWQARTLDLDILLYDHECINTIELTIPHPGLTLRSFVIYPLLEIAPNLILPNGIRLESFKKEVLNNLCRVEQFS